MGESDGGGIGTGTDAVLSTENKRCGQMVLLLRTVYRRDVLPDRKAGWYSDRYCWPVLAFLRLLHSPSHRHLIGVGVLLLCVQP